MRFLPQQLIAGEMTLSTRNGKHVRNIKGLQLEIVRYPKESDAQERFL
jgi:hypothetical protein